MVSRRKILSRSRDDLNLDQTFSQPEEEEDVWYQKDKLFKEHIQEVLDKWTQIDDEIWAKVIVFERNRRVAKAYARAPVLTINGSDDGFDGMRIGLCGFDNPMRDQKTDELKRHVGQGLKIKMDDAGNILIRRYSKSNIYVKSTASSPNEETAIGADILKLPSQALESEKIVKLFDMKKFQSNVNRELRRAYPDRRRLETQCLSTIAFVKAEPEILDCSIWVLIVNVVAMDMLKTKLPPVQRPVDIRNRPRIPIPDEDPYSVAGSGGGSSGSSGFGANGGTAAGHVAATREQLLIQTQQHTQRRSEKPPKLPPRDNIYPHDIPKPDYDDIGADNRLNTFARGKSDKGKDNKKYDDPYYCGLRARVPNFVKTKANKDKETIAANGTSQKKMSTPHMVTPQATPQLAPLHQLHSIHKNPAHIMAAHQHHQQMMWHARSFESGIGIYSHMNYMLDHPFTCPYRDMVHNSNNDQHKIDKTINKKNTIPNDVMTSPTSLMQIQNPYYSRINNDNYGRYYFNSPIVPSIVPTNLYPNEIRPLPIASSKWHSESEIFDMEKDENDSVSIYDTHDKPPDMSLPDHLSPTQLQFGKINTNQRPNVVHRKVSQIYDGIYEKNKPAKLKAINKDNIYQLDSDFETKRKMSISTESFFQGSLHQPTFSDTEFDEGLKPNINLQKGKIEQHLNLIIKKDSVGDQHLNLYSPKRISMQQSHHQRHQTGMIPSAIPVSRRGRMPSRIYNNNDIKRDRSLYDYRSPSESKFDSDLESIYGYLKPRKPRSHGIKVNAK